MHGLIKYVPTPRSTPVRHFLDWTQPLPLRFASWFWQQAPASKHDFSDWVMIVPTAESGRKLRSHLVHGMPDSRAGFLSPRIQTPAQFLRHNLKSQELANRNDCLLAWAKCLQQAAPDVQEQLFGFGPTGPRPNRSWALKSARLLQRLKTTLAEGNHDFASVARIGFEETERWQCLAELEKSYRELMRAEGLKDPDDALIRTAAEGSPIEPGERILLAGLPDPIPLLIHCFEQATATNQPEVLIAAPESQAEAFDPWGRPLELHWARQKIPADRLQGRIHPSADSHHSLTLLKACIDRIENPQTALSLGLGEPELASRVQDELGSLGMTAHDPQGVPARRTDIPSLLNAWREWTRLDDFQTLHRLLSFPDIERYYSSQDSNLRKNLDRFSTRYLPATLSSVEALDSDPQFEALRACIQRMRSDRQNLQGGPKFSDQLQKWLQSLWQGIDWDSQTDPLRATLLPEMRDWLKEWQSSAFSRDATADEALQLFESHLLSSRCYPPRPEQSIDLNGWLELLWDDRHCLCFMHLNEGLVPQTVSHDPFLPDSLRKRLGLPCNDQRFGRDAYQFRFLIESRWAEGRCDWIVGRHTLAGDPLKPSRLLFLCPQNELPERVQQILSSLPDPQPEPPPSLAWQLDPSRVEPRKLERISATDFKNYLECPFRFYLRRMLSIEAWPDSLVEMDARAYGNLAHEALQSFNDSEQMLDESRVETIAKALLKELDAVFERHYGRAASVTLELQRISLRERLQAAAGAIAEARAEGWRPFKVEWKFSDDLEPPRIAGLALSGIIDLIEYQASTDSYRIIDYKTSEKATNPMDAHLKKLGRNETPEDFRPHTLFEWHGQTYRWINLQLPLYLWVTQHHIAQSTSVAYFNLPRASGETRIEAWLELDEECMKSALHCAEGVVADIQGNRFWPPGKCFADKALDAWLEPDIEAVIHPNAIARLQRGADT